MAATEEPLNRIHVNNLAWSIKEEELKEFFSEFGEIEKVKIPTRPKGGSKGFGFITFKTNEAAKDAVEKMNNVNLQERRIGVVFSTSVEKKKEQPVGDDEKGNRLVVRQLAWAVTDEQLEEAFAEHGTLTNHKVVKARNGKSKGFGFVVYETPEQAQAAKEAMDGKEIEGRAITVHFSNSTGGRKKQSRPKKDEMDEASPAKGRSNRKRRQNRRKNNEQNEIVDENGESAPAPKQRQRKRNKLYCKISTDTTEEDLRGVFTAFGALKKVDIPKNKEGEVKGHAYLQFETEEDAEKALDSSKTTELNGTSLQTDWARFRRGGGDRRRTTNPAREN